MAEGLYRHFKNKQLYQIVGLARHSETLEELVVYRALYDSEEFGRDQLWVRPKAMFFENVTHEGCIVPRFELL